MKDFSNNVNNYIKNKEDEIVSLVGDRTILSKLKKMDLVNNCMALDNKTISFIKKYYENNNGALILRTNKKEGKIGEYLCNPVVFCEKIQEITRDDSRTVISAQLKYMLNEKTNVILESYGYKEKSMLITDDQLITLLNSKGDNKNNIAVLNFLNYERTAKAKEIFGDISDEFSNFYENVTLGGQCVFNKCKGIVYTAKQNETISSIEGKPNNYSVNGVAEYNYLNIGDVTGIVTRNNDFDVFEMDSSK